MHFWLKVKSIASALAMPDHSKLILYVIPERVFVCPSNLLNRNLCCITLEIGSSSLLSVEVEQSPSLINAAKQSSCIDSLMGDRLSVVDRL
jgi:hypothetical protein